MFLNFFKHNQQNQVEHTQPDPAESASADDLWKLFREGVSAVESTATQEAADELQSLRQAWLSPGDVSCTNESQALFYTQVSRHLFSLVKLIYVYVEPES